MQSSIPTAALLALALTAPLNAQSTFIEDYETGTNVGSWSWGTGNQSISPLNGNPGAYLKDLTLNSCCPSASTQFGSNSIFTGDYRALGVTSLGIDLVTLNASVGIGDRPLSLLLIDDKGTPGNFNDDSMVYFIGTDLVPGAGSTSFAPAGWTSFDFQVPSHMSTLPQGWIAFTPGSESDDQVWNDVISDVDTVQFFYGDPASIFLFISWDVGMDNPRISFNQAEGTTSCFGDGSGTSCPCGNTGGPGAGCLNSSGSGASIAAFGAASVGSNSLVLEADSAVPSVTGLFFGGVTLQGAGNGIPFGDGLLCTGGSITRLQIVPTDGQGHSSSGIDIAATDGSMPGDTRHYQFWYRDPSVGPCASGFNTSNLVSVTWQP